MLFACSGCCPSADNKFSIIRVCSSYLFPDKTYVYSIQTNVICCLLLLKVFCVDDLRCGSFIAIRWLFLSHSGNRSFWIYLGLVAHDYHVLRSWLTQKGPMSRKVSICVQFQMLLAEMRKKNKDVCQRRNTETITDVKEQIWLPNICDSHIKFCWQKKTKYFCQTSNT